MRFKCKLLVRKATVTQGKAEISRNMGLAFWSVHVKDDVRISNPHVITEWQIQAIIAGLAERRRRARSLAKKRAKSKSGGRRRPSCIRGNGDDNGGETSGEAAEAAARGQQRRCTIL